MRISAIELLARSRIGEVIEVPVTQTHIWVQIGAFYNKVSANSVLNRYESAQGSVSEGLHNGKPIYKARIGPITTVEDADIILSDVLKFGFEGAHIIVD
ncbi:MAG: SPOR domain-containing protein [Alphaproteobacteria bacterium]|nr:SPOR domain-containing protein [Alphaproteobacteria bacterium]